MHDYDSAGMALVSRFYVDLAQLTNAALRAYGEESQRLREEVSMLRERDRCNRQMIYMLKAGLADIVTGGDGKPTAAELVARARQAQGNEKPDEAAVRSSEAHARTSFVMSCHEPLSQELAQRQCLEHEEAKAWRDLCVTAIRERPRVAKRARLM